MGQLGRSAAPDHMTTVPTTALSTRPLPGGAWADRLAALRGRLLGGLGVSLSLAAAACAPTGQGDSKLPDGVQDPASLHTPAGARELYRGALLTLPPALDAAMLQSGVFTDELAALPTPAGVIGAYTDLDRRTNDVADAEDQAYSRLHHARAQLSEARGFLAAYVPDSAPVERGHLYAAEGYADLLLADLFCSGIPLSTVDFNGDYTLAAGSTTSEVYRHALALFDTARALAGGAAGAGPLAMDTVQPLAALGRGRALLALGHYDSAAQAVAAVPTAYRYQVTVGRWLMGDFANNGGGPGGTLHGYATVPGVPGVGEHEGLTGLGYRSDRRTGDTLPLGIGLYGAPYYFPRQFDPGQGAVALTLASGLEARLIEAEAALRGQLPGGPDWLTVLNTLRTDGTSEEVSTNDPNDPAATYTRWHAGTGGVDSLAPLADPGDPRAREDMLFAERAFWLYLTAHRLGDLRRLVRQYQRSGDEVYPTGAYVDNGASRYGTAVTLPVPAAEPRLNPTYSGCHHRNA